MYKILLLSVMYSRLAGCPSISLLSALSEPSQWHYLRGTQWTSKIIPNSLIYFIGLLQGIRAVLLTKWVVCPTTPRTCCWEVVNSGWGVLNTDLCVLLIYSACHKLAFHQHVSSIILTTHRHQVISVLSVLFVTGSIGQLSAGLAVFEDKDIAVCNAQAGYSWSIEMLQLCSSLCYLLACLWYCKFSLKFSCGIHCHLPSVDHHSSFVGTIALRLMA